MRIKTIFLIVATILLTIIIMQNNQPFDFNILFFHTRISILVVLALVAIIAFIIGVLIGRPRKVKFDDSHPSMDNPTGTKNDTLSDEDREYIK
jgi:uncharacterized integral membrane protein